MYKLHLQFYINNISSKNSIQKRDLNIIITKNENTVLKYNILNYNDIMDENLYNSIEPFLINDNELFFYYNNGDAYIKFKNNKIKFVLYNDYEPIYFQTQFYLNNEELKQFKQEFKEKLIIYNDNI